MKKYAIITINHKNAESGIEFRKILISYKDYKDHKEGDEYRGKRIYTGVKILAKDAYFTEPNDLHRFSYDFDSKEDLMAVTYLADSGKYETVYKPYSSIYDRDLFLAGLITISVSIFDGYLPDEFECESDDDAILRFEIERNF